MIKDAKLKDGKIPHLIGPSASGHYRFQASMSKKTAQRVSDVLIMLKEQFASSTMSAAFCDAVEALKELWQLRSRIAHALEICDDIGSPGDDDPESVVADLIRMALLGCPTSTNTIFTGELSPEYTERYGDE